MIISLDTRSSVPIYVQLRNQIVTGIGRGELKAGESLPTVRQLAADAGVNTMTVNKTYQILKAEGFIEIDRRKGASVCDVQAPDAVFEGFSFWLQWRFCYLYYVSTEPGRSFFHRMHSQLP